MPMLSPRALPASPASRHKTVVIADDSVVVRGLFARWLGEAGNFHVVALMWNIIDKAFINFQHIQWELFQIG